MITKGSQFVKILTGILGFCLGAALQVHAQGARGGGAGTTARTYPPNGQVGDAYISVDPTTKQVFFSADEETARYVRQVLTSLDRPAPQVLIKVVFLEVQYNNASDIGIEGYIKGPIGNNQGIASNIFGLASSGFNPIPPGAGIYTILGNDFQATLRAISQAGKLEVLSRPSILTRNNQQATISLGQSVPLITSTRFDTLGNQINTVTYQSVGIILQVTPFITPEGMVEMIISPQISQLADRTQWVPISSGPSGSVSAPVINQRTADTVVVVPDAQTVVIGGLMQNNKQTSDSKIPILGDIPLIGNAFKRSVKNYTKTELIIFLTPHVVAQPTDLAQLSATEREQSAIAPKAFSEQELDRFLDKLPAKGGTTATNSAAPGSGAAPANTSGARSQSTRNPGK